MNNVDIVESLKKWAEDSLTAYLKEIESQNLTPVNYIKREAYIEVYNSLLNNINILLNNQQKQSN